MSVPISEDAELRELFRGEVAERSAALESGAKRKITRAIHEILSTDIDVDYREDSEMVFGVRLTIGDHLVEWSASRYLDRLKTEFDEIVDVASRAPAAADEAAGDAGDTERETA